MPFNVATFRASLLADGARAALFDVILTLPATVAALVPGPVTLDIAFKARATSLPGDSVSSIPVNYFGREIKVAGTRTFPDWSITVINDENFLIRNSMEIWMNGINSHVGNLRAGDLATSVQYQGDALVNQYAKTGELIKQYKMVGLFPIDVAAQDLDWASGDQIEEFGITFAYQWWETVATPVNGTITAGPGSPQL
jgi:hypothetical protein